MLTTHYPERLHHADFLSARSSFAIRYNELDELYPVHWHEFYELSYILEGEGTHLWNGARYPLKSGSMYLLTPADFHELVPYPGSVLKKYNVLFAEELLDDELYRLLFADLEPNYAHFSDNERERMSAEFRRLGQESDRTLPGHGIAVQCTLKRILVDLIRNRPQSVRAVDGHHSVQASVRRALIYMHHHFREPLSLQTAARQAQLSPNYFSECFKAVTGFSFQSCLQGLRLQFAGSLLSVSDLPVIEVCYSSGFNTLSHFNRAFKRKFGCAPGQYQRQNREERKYAE